MPKEKTGKAGLEKILPTKTLIEEKTAAGKTAAATTVPAGRLARIPIAVNTFGKTTVEAVGAAGKDRSKFADALNLALKQRIISSVASPSDELKTAVNKLSLNYANLAAKDLNTVIAENVLPALKATPAVQQELKGAAVDPTAGAATVSEILNLDRPIKDNPIFASDVRRAKTLELAGIAKLDSKSAGRLADKAVVLDRAGAETWNGLVADGTIAVKDLPRLKTVFALSRFTGDNFDLIKALKPGSVDSPRDLASLEKSDWLKLIRDNKVQTPNGETAEDYASALTSGMERVFPTQFLLHRLVKTTAADVANAPGTANAYKYLGVPEILADPKIRPAEKHAAIAGAVGKLAAFFKGNPDADLRSVDFFNRSAAPARGFANVSWEGLAAEDQPKVRRQLMAYQRVMNLSPDYETSRALLLAGHDTSFSIAEQTEQGFVQSSGLMEDKAVYVHRNARRAALGVSHAFEAARAAAKGDFSLLRVGNDDPALVNDLRAIDGYDALFGSQNYADCPDDRTIFSPAAYFVDLMSFIEKNVTSNAFTGANANHPLCLKRRRPDLWTLPLTGENTFGMVPALGIVNNVLEQYLNGAVASQGDVYAALAASGISLRLPFHLPLETLRLYLSHFNLTLHDVYLRLSRDASETARENLLLSAEERSLILTPAPSSVPAFFGNPTALSSLDVADFMRRTGLTRDELDQMLALKFVNPDGGVTIVSQADRSDIQKFNETVQGFDAASLDRAVRFLRLWKKLGWTLPEAGLALESLGRVGQDVNAPTILQLAAFKRLREKSGIPLTDLFTLAQTPARADQPGLCEAASGLGELFSGAATVTVPLLDAGAADDATARKIALSLGLSSDGLRAVLSFLTDNGQIPVDPSGKAVLDHQGAARVYRHARLSLAMNVPMDQFLKLVQLSVGAPLSTLDQMETLWDARAWLGGSPLSLPELYFAATGAVRYQVTTTEIASMVEGIQHAKGLYFDATLLDGIDGLADGKGFLGKMLDGGLLVPGPDGKSFRLSASFAAGQDLTPIFTAESIPAPGADLTEAVGERLHARLPGNVFASPKDALAPALLERFKASQAMLDAFAPFMKTSIDDAALAAGLSALITSGAAATPSALDALCGLVWDVERLQLLAQRLNLGADDFVFVAANPAVFQISDPHQLSADNIRRMDRYARLPGLKDATAVPLRQLLSAFQTANAPGLKVFNDDQLELLGLLLGGKADDLKRLQTAVPWPGNALDAVEEAGRRLDLCGLLGVGANDLPLLAATDYVSLGRARDAVFAGFKSKYPDADDWDKVNTPYDDRINELKRDALCEYVLAQPALKFKDRDDLYKFFLIDVSVSGSARVSEVVSGISSLQLYVHRCLMNLEQSDSGDVRVHPDWIPKDQWEGWRKNYRVWEANRKVFLYPENYLEPELRDNKSPQFMELEDELLQKKITLEAAEDAYMKYLTQFAELGRLKIAGSCYDEGKNAFYLFGVSPTDPPQYYYRQFDPLGRQWTSWQKIDLTISSDKVTAIVFNSRLHLFWVDVTILDVNKVAAGASTFDHYDAKARLNYSCLNEAGKWAPPQKLDNLAERSLPTKDEKDAFLSSRLTNKAFPYIGPGPNGSRILELDYYGGNRWRLDFYGNQLVGPLDPETKINSGELSIFQNVGGDAALLLPGFYYGYFTPVNYEEFLVATTEHIDDYSPVLLTNMFDNSLVDSDMVAVNGNTGVSGDFVVRFLGQQFLIVKNANKDIPSKRLLIRQTTTIPGSLGVILFNGGLDQLLTIQTQKGNNEISLGGLVTLNNLPELSPFGESADGLPFDGPCGLYLWEMFFHLPSLIANHLNADRKFEEAKEWYEKIFDPATREQADQTQPADRVWQFLKFRGLGSDALKTILADKAALALYASDPFSPHAIARLRPSAYQKATVMKYIDNLIDWGDDLFSQFSTESVNEAVMLYVLASDILGPRPVKVGECETPPDDDMTYEKIGPTLQSDSDLLIFLENWVQSAGRESLYRKLPQGAAVFEEGARLERYDDKSGTDAPPAAPARDAVNGLGMRKQYQVFGVPRNETLLDYWDRVEDRLFKIRNGLNMAGVKQQLPLFQPPIDPALLVRAKAAGLSLDDIMGLINETPPAYRFHFLLEKARSFISTVQSFGGALLSALEKKDAEELSLLRSTHEQNILKMTKDVKNQQVQEAIAGLFAAQEGKTNIQNRIDYYQGLLDNGLTGWESTQQISRHTATGLKLAESIVHLQAALTYLIPQLGSPFAMTYGGNELGDSGVEFAQWTQSMASIADAVSSSAGLEASFQRRREEWQHQLTLAQQEIKQADQQIIAADFRRQISESDSKIHQKNIDQSRELYEYYQDKFTSLGLYNYLSTSLYRLYHTAYTLAFDLAKTAERAYRFELPDADDGFFIQSDNWQGDRAGLLAGESLLVQLQNMEKAYLENNLRNYEITQSFSMRQLNSQALLDLKNSGACDFQIPEIAFDLFYPGQYQRIIKSVRLTIPCVAGPHTNVGCKLTLGNNKVRYEATADLVDGPRPSTMSVATSNAVNDGGLFEMNFRDERYMPFEGAGAVSSWHLELPGVFRAFDYDTISDVICHVSYTAKDNVALRGKVEQTVANAIKSYAASGLYRLVSLKHDFPAVWGQLSTQGAADVGIGPNQKPLLFFRLPLFSSDGKTTRLAPALTGADVYLLPKAEAAIDDKKVAVWKVNEAPVVWVWTDGPTGTKKNKESISMTGESALSLLVGPDFDAAGVDDVVVLLKYELN